MIDHEIIIDEFIKAELARGGGADGTEITNQISVSRGVKILK